MKIVVLQGLVPFFVGAMFGSFLNVCIHRIPLKLSLFSPGSYCPNCKVHIRWYDNIPVVSYLFLRGRCRDCSYRIPLRYPLVELIAGLSAMVLIKHYGYSVLSIEYIVLVYILIVVTMIDLEHLIIPNEVIIPGIGAGFIFLLMNKIGIGWVNALLGGLLMGGFLYASGGLGKLLFRKESMGMGDVKLGVLIGIFIGWKWVIVALFLTFFSAGFYGLMGLIAGRIKFGQKVPFAPFLFLGTLLTLFTGDWIIQWYNALFFQ